MNPVKKAYLQLHIAVLLYGFTAILGDLISLPAVILVWWRVLMASVGLFFLIQFGKNLHRLPTKLILQYMGIGILVGLHWISFFGSIKYSNASIALVCVATTSFFTAFLEPILLGQKIKGYEILLGLMVVPGMMFIVQNVDSDMVTGIWVGLLSAFLAALFATLNKKLVNKAAPMEISFLELGSALLFISCLLPFYFYIHPQTNFLPVGYDWFYLFALASACTILAYVLALVALKHISAFAANLTINLEPVYGIVLAWLILNEHKELSSGFYLGCAMILLAVFSYPLLKSKLNSSET